MINFFKYTVQLFIDKHGCYFLLEIRYNKLKEKNCLHVFFLQFKRTSGPLNRRSPSRRKSRGSTGDEEEETPSEDIPVPVKHNKMSEDLDLIMETPSNNNQENEADGDMNHNHPKPRVAFLELTNNREEIEKRGSPDMSPSRSPSNSRKPFIPLLDLSTLHQHVDSTGTV